ncbi:MAG: hypothetical protein ACD_57C00117G0002 [uncultured bacterium]|nr:MAG: hypothetical protein ACD_57C00117G0002 [uncultured bacterium]
MANERIDVTPRGPSQIGLRRRVSGAAENVVNSIRVAPQWHILAVANGIIAVIGDVMAAENLLEGDIMKPTYIAGASTFFMLNSVISELYAASYLGDYKKIRKSLTKHGWDERIVEQKVGTYCERRAATIAAVDSGYIDEFDEYLHK